METDRIPLVPRIADRAALSTRPRMPRLFKQLRQGVGQFRRQQNDAIDTYCAADRIDGSGRSPCCGSRTQKGKGIMREKRDKIVNKDGKTWRNSEQRNSDSFLYSNSETSPFASSPRPEFTHDDIERWTSDEHHLASAHLVSTPKKTKNHVRPRDHLDEVIAATSVSSVPRHSSPIRRTRGVDPTFRALERDLDTLFAIDSSTSIKEQRDGYLAPRSLLTAAVGAFRRHSSQRWSEPLCSDRKSKKGMSSKTQTVKRRLSLPSTWLTFTRSCTKPKQKSPSPSPQTSHWEVLESKKSSDLTEDYCPRNSEGGLSGKEKVLGPEKWVSNDLYNYPSTSFDSLASSSSSGRGSWYSFTSTGSSDSDTDDELYQSWPALRKRKRRSSPASDDSSCDSSVFLAEGHRSSSDESTHSGDILASICPPGVDLSQLSDGDEEPHYDFVSEFSLEDLLAQCPEGSFSSATHSVEDLSDDIEDVPTKDNTYETLDVLCLHLNAPLPPKLPERHLMTSGTLRKRGTRDTFRQPVFV